ncbi:hypothetical protein BDY21DRAFT_350596 [Lineolata rhizophorae]|uniref:Uncharacterized protein n=1 Tax=Lineolata rhizophorae TaxID=578093 RepID=A0A6A6NUC0_9PEZI|nr:hypothetical protein BDY21DRAFT_350596 [Lineolata rhizophorae]
MIHLGHQSLLNSLAPKRLTCISFSSAAQQFAQKYSQMKPDPLIYAHRRPTSFSGSRVSPPNPTTMRWPNTYAPACTHGQRLTLPPPTSYATYVHTSHVRLARAPDQGAKPTHDQQARPPSPASPMTPWHQAQAPDAIQHCTYGWYARSRGLG